MHAYIDIHVMLLPHIWCQKPNLRYLSFSGNKKKHQPLPKNQNKQTPQQTKKKKKTRHEKLTT